MFKTIILCRMMVKAVFLDDLGVFLLDLGDELFPCLGDILLCVLANGLVELLMREDPDDLLIHRELVFCGGKAGKVLFYRAGSVGAFCQERGNA